MKNDIRITFESERELTQLFQQLVKYFPPKQQWSIFTEQVVKHYQQAVALEFSARILQKGLADAAKMYNLIVKTEYQRYCELLTNYCSEAWFLEQVLGKLTHVKTVLLAQAIPYRKKQGIEIFYQLTGGNRLKYQSARQHIYTLYYKLTQKESPYMFSVPFFSRIASLFAKWRVNWRK